MAVKRELNDVKVLAKTQASRLAELESFKISLASDVLLIIEGLQTELAALKELLLAPSSSPFVPPASHSAAVALERLQLVENAHSASMTELAQLRVTHEATVAELTQLEGAHRDQGQELARLKMALKMLCEGPSVAEQHASVQSNCAPPVASGDTAHAEQLADRVLDTMRVSSSFGHEVAEADVKSTSNEHLEAGEAERKVGL